MSVEQQAKTETKPCGNCGADVKVRVPDMPASSAIARLAASIKVLCPTCSEEDARAVRKKQEESWALAAKGQARDNVERSGLPKRHRLTLDRLGLSPELERAARGWVRGGGGLMLTGDIGRGKTTVAGACCWERLQQSRVIWTSAPLLFARLGSGLGSEQRDWALEVLASKTALVLDDIDKARPTEYGAEQVFLAVDQRVEHELPLLVTTNLAPSELASRFPDPYGAAIASRLVGYCLVVRVEGPDRRLSPGRPLRQEGDF